MGKLTARQCSTLGPGKHNDGEGLWLAVAPSGSRKWFLRITVDGKRREMGLGRFGTGPDCVSLAEARERAFEARAQVAKGIDPIEARQEVEETIPSFVTAAARYIRAHRRGWSNRKHARQWVRTLKTYARPVLGSRAVDEISTEEVLKIRRPIWTTRTETAKRVQGRIENVLDFSAARKWRDPFNPARWRGHLDKLLPRPTRVKRVRPQPAMQYTALPAFTVISNIYTVEIRLLSLKESLNPDSSKIIGFVDNVNVDFILPTILIPQQNQVTELVPIALEFIVSSIDLNHASRESWI